jgi:ABC-type transport system involved in Fe-S cluster assembly fused permease/ATPase subunit
MKHLKELKQPTFADLDELSLRWHCHRQTAKRRMRRFGVKAVKLSERSVLFRMSDIARVEKECMG